MFVDVIDTLIAIYMYAHVKYVVVIVSRFPFLIHKLMNRYVQSSLTLSLSRIGRCGLHESHISAIVLSSMAYTKKLRIFTTATTNKQTNKTK